MVTLAVPFAGDAGADGHIEDAVSDRQRGGERAAVDVRHRDAGDRQDAVLGEGLRGRHGVDRGVVPGNDTECRRCGRDGRAIRYEPSQGPLRTRVEVGGIVARRLKSDRLQQRLVVRDRTRPGEDQRMQRWVPGKRDAVHDAAGGAVDGQGVAVAGKRPGGDLHGGGVELGVVRVGETG
jgi:hypothetical protein